MNRFDGTAARQLDLIALIEPVAPTPVRKSPERVRPNFRLLKQDVYAELLRRRRRAQIAARHALERADQDAFER
jgi:hypothetical protein